MSLRGATFTADGVQLTESLIDDRVCECCPTAAVATAGGAIAAFRNRGDDETRDIHVARFEHGVWTHPVAVHDDGWRIDACPVNRPAMSANGRDVAIAWFHARYDQGHAYVAFSHDGGQSFSAPVRADDSATLGRVDVQLVEPRRAIVACDRVRRRTGPVSRAENRRVGTSNGGHHDRRARCRPRERLPAAGEVRRRAAARLDRNQPRHVARQDRRGAAELAVADFGLRIVDFKRQPGERMVRRHLRTDCRRGRSRHDRADARALRRQQPDGDERSAEPHPGTGACQWRDVGYQRDRVSELQPRGSLAAWRRVAGHRARWLDVRRSPAGPVRSARVARAAGGLHAPVRRANTRGWRADSVVHGVARRQQTRGLSGRESVVCSGGCGRQRHAAAGRRRVAGRLAS